MGVHLERAQLLFEQSRFGQAEQELRRELTHEPDSAQAHALLGLCLAEQGQMAAALDAAQQAVRLGPDQPFAFYALADVLHDLDSLMPARKAAEEAIRLDPVAAAHHALLAGIWFKLERWDEVMATAERGLALDPRNVDCGNLRGLALLKLKRAEEAAAVFTDLLALDPTNAHTHAHLGWALLQQGEGPSALPHFREALRLDPDTEGARQGIVEAVKRRYLVYHALLRFVLWASRLGELSRAAVLVGGIGTFLGLHALAESRPDLAGWTWPLLLTGLIFGMLVWIADPLFNLLLLLNADGRKALSREQVAASIWVGAFLLLAIGAGITWGMTGTDAAGWAALACVLFTVPLAGVFDCPPGRSRRAMIGYASMVGLAGLSGVVLLAMYGVGHILLWLFLLGVGVSGWVALGLILMQSRGG